MKLFRYVLIVTAFIQSVVTYADHPLISYFEQKAKLGILSSASVKEAREQIELELDEHGRVTQDSQNVFNEIETRFYSHFDQGAILEFQTWIAETGGKQLHVIQMPKNDLPFWHIGEGHLDSYRSSAELPANADYVVIGAGLTGVSTAYHLIKQVGPGKTVVVLESESPASQATGRNGGNFQLLHESYVGHYEGLVEEQFKWLRSQEPNTPSDQLMEKARNQTQIVFELTHKNFVRFRELIEREKIECDFSPKGWLRIATSKLEEEALLRDIEWIRSIGIGPANRAWSIQEIEDRTGVKAKFLGRFIEGNGNFHPKKFVTEVLSRSLKQGVLLYTHVLVSGIKIESKNSVTIETSEGTIQAGKVIVATNAFTSKLLPELSAIEPAFSQIMNLEHVRNSLDGMTLTELQGDVYYNFPSSTHYVDSSRSMRGMLHFGMDVIDGEADPSNLVRSTATLERMKAFTDKTFPETRGQPPSRVWVGPMAFTPDRIPVIGFMDSPEIIVAAGFQGYGGSFCIEAGYLAAQMAVTGEIPSEIPEEMFAPQRFIKR